MRTLVVVFSVLTLALVAGPLFAGESEKPSRSKKDAVSNDKRFHERLKAAAAVYKAYGRVDDDVRWAPFKCSSPSPSPVRFSGSADSKTHGRKLYWLYAKKHTDYVWKWDADNPVPVGQLIVKESWSAETVAEVPEKPAQNEKTQVVGDGETQMGWGKQSIVPKGETAEVQSYMNPFIEKDGKVFRAKQIAGLFVMLKLDPKTEGTDAGWVYGTLTADGKTVTSAGKVATCMKCHRDAPRERLFGIPKPAPKAKPKTPDEPKK